MSQTPATPIPSAPKPQRFSALAWTALILGIVGIVGSPIIILNNLTAIAAGVGVILGVIALFGSRKVLAVIGVGLCVAAIAITVAVQGAAVDELDRIVSGDTEATVLGFGEQHTWPDGLAVEVSAPAGCEPGEFAAPQNVQRAVKVTVTVVNGTDKPFEAGQLAVGSAAQFAGRSAESVFDSDGGCGTGGMDSATVLPGKTFTYDLAFAVGAEPGELQLTVQPSFGEAKAVYSGTA